VACRIDRRVLYSVLVGGPEGKRPLGRPRHRGEDSIKIDIQYIGWGGMYWIDFLKDRDGWRALLNTVINLRDSTKCGELFD
jgi:hypothetical protein